MGAASIVSHAVSRVRADGFAVSCRYAAYRITNEFLLWRFRLRPAMAATAGLYRASDLGADPTTCGAHVPLPAVRFAAFRAAMRRYVRPTPADVFLDYGSGLGRGLLMAATFPFERVIGVERSAHLNESATAIFESAAARLRCQRAQFLTMDATLRDPPDDATVLYFFSPFYGAVLRDVMRRICGALERSPRNMRLVTDVPADANYGHGQLTIDDWLGDQEIFDLVGEVRYPANYPGEPFRVWRAKTVRQL